MWTFHTPARPWMQCSRPWATLEPARLWAPDHGMPPVPMELPVLDTPQHHRATRPARLCTRPALVTVLRLPATALHRRATAPRLPTIRPRHPRTRLRRLRTLLRRLRIRLRAQATA